MKVDITYETNADAEFCCCAKTEVQGRDYFGIGKTWEHAKENLMQKLNARYGTVAPPPETVEIKVAGEEMQTEFVPWESLLTDAQRREIEANEIGAGKV